MLREKGGANARQASFSKLEAAKMATLRSWARSFRRRWTGAGF